MKLKVGILFGGCSREREVSFAGGRTVYDNLDKSIFEPVLLFADSFGNLVLINWELAYKGSIRDFYPPASQMPDSPHGFRVYAESMGDLSAADQRKLIEELGTPVEPSVLHEHIDFAFLCLHGADGEDGRIQGLLEFYRIPYSGSGIFPSATGMNKALQKRLMKQAGFHMPDWQVIRREQWLEGNGQDDFYKSVRKQVGFPCVVKAANQGSSIGVSALMVDDREQFAEVVDRAFFVRRIRRSDWQARSFDENVEFIRQLSDIREGIGVPARISGRVMAHPEELFSVVRQLFSEQEAEVLVESCDGEHTVVVEAFIEGREFSCIVIGNNDGTPVALPPTEIRKGKEVFDYRAKYLPGLSRKVTPIDLPDEAIENIRGECEKLFTSLQFDVYARIDGFYAADGTITLNDPNTTSGMMPSSFFFHQAAEIGLNPTQFITYIIRTSLAARMKDLNDYRSLPYLVRKLDQAISESNRGERKKMRVAVILGGYSSERHISVESGRNVYEKLASSEKYEPFPVFLSGDADSYTLYRIPVNLLLKDNADDIKEKIESFSRHPVVQRIIDRCGDLTERYASAENLAAPRALSMDELSASADAVFIGLHGRPGEDGALQQELGKAQLPYNGSGPAASSVAIDKYRTNEILRNNGFHTASHAMVSEEDWRRDPSAMEDRIRRDFLFPFIAKPVDDGCSSAVKLIRDENEFHAYAELVFRNSDELNRDAAALLKIKHNEEFPAKNAFLVEQLITRMNAAHFLEITGGLLTHYDDKGGIIYEVFEASEALTEGDVLSLEEKFLAGQGMNITPARYSHDPARNTVISDKVKAEFERAARLLQLEGYARIDAFVRIFDDGKVEVIFIEVNSLPGMTPATCIFHQAAIAQYKPFEFVDRIIEFGIMRRLASEKSN